MGFYDNIRNGAKTVGNNLSALLLGQQAAPTSAMSASLMDDDVLNYQNYLRQNGYDENTVNGVTQGLNGGNKEIAEWINQYNNGIGKNNPINIPQTQEEIGLAQQGLFNTPKLQGGTSYSPRVGGLIPDFVNGYRENYNNNFTPNNWGANTLPDGRTKGFGYKAGELLGSVGKFIDSPLGRGVLAAGLNKALGYDNSLQEGLTAAVGRQSAQTADSIFRNQLSQMGYTEDDLSNIRGNVTPEIFKALTSGFRLGNQRMTYAQLAMFDEGIAEQVRQNPELANQFVPVTFAKDIYGKKNEKATADIESIKAKTAKTKAETNQVGKPKVYKTIKEGHVVVDHNHNSSGGGNGKTGPSKPLGASNTNTGKVKMRYQGKTYLVDANRVDEYKKAGGEVVR